jgi:hypothetical protein
MSSPDTLSVFDNTLATFCVHITLERDASTLMRLLEFFALRGTLPLRVAFDAFAGTGSTGRLRVQARLGRHDWRVLCERAATLVGVVEVSDGVPPGELLPSYASAPAFAFDPR